MRYNPDTDKARTYEELVFPGQVEHQAILDAKLAALLEDEDTADA